MKQVFKCEYCDFIGNEKDVRVHELTCPNKCTGYERVEFNRDYYTHLSDGTIYCQSEKEDGCDDRTYNVANYYSSKKVAEDNARADVLMRQLRRFAVKHRTNELDWNGERFHCLGKAQIGKQSPRIIRSHQ